ncbi:hypothetical protein RRG08_041812 [Elysia crispata]|uniref:Costars domain-containing protein n=1 Tax=Elysia crispata TaxID=231223 RepID=A0AAE1D4G2_9GAST|nr:hypothetical protein RRG08_041812 [Elysia crispata]
MIGGGACFHHHHRHTLPARKQAGYAVHLKPFAPLPYLKYTSFSWHNRLVSHTQFTMNVEHEVNLLVEEINRLGSPGPDGKMQVKFGILFNDDRCANIFEALVGTLRAAKRKKIVTYDGELLLQGVHDNVVISLL